MTRYSEIVEQATRCRRLCGSRNPWRLAESLDVDVLLSDLGRRSTSVKAMTVINSRCGTIMINCNFSDICQEFLLAHELGHYVMHKDHFGSQIIEQFYFDPNQHMEVEANLFAAEFLLDDGIIEEWQEGYTLEQLASMHYVPYELMVYKVYVLQHKGYVIPNLPAWPRSDFLGEDIEGGV